MAVAAGWYADPMGAAPYRWWDGAAWTTHTSDGQPDAGAGAAVEQTQPAYYGQPAQAYAQPAYGQPYRTGTAQTASAQPGPVQPYVHHTPTQGYGQPAGSGFGLPPRQGSPGNGLAFATMGVSAVYLLLALAAGIVFLGIVPIAFAVRSFRAREPLAPVAIGAAAIAVLVSISTLVGH